MPDEIAGSAAGNPRLDNARRISAPRGPQLSAKSWLTEAPLRMLMNNLDAEVAEKPEELVVYGGIGRAATVNPSEWLSASDGGHWAVTALGWR